MAERQSRARCDEVEPTSCSSSLFEHDLFGKPVSTFPDHALARSAGRDTKANGRPFDGRPLILRQTGSPCGCSEFRPDRARSETVIHAELDLADVRPIGQESGAVACKRRMPAEGEEVVFGLGGPVLAKVKLGAEANRPADPCIGGCAVAAGCRTCVIPANDGALVGYLI